jgi:hypothetical protein
MKRRVLNARSGPRLLSQTSAAVPNDDDDNDNAQLERGTYFAPYRLGGYRVLMAIDSRGERRLEIPLGPGSEAVDVCKGLEIWLDEIDPLLKKGDEKPITMIRALRLMQ